MFGLKCVGEKKRRRVNTHQSTIMDALNETEKATATKLTGLGLPEGQAIASSKALTAGTPAASQMPACVYVMMKINEGADKAALKEAFEAYATASKKAPGKVTAGHGWDEEKGKSTMVLLVPCYLA